MISLKCIGLLFICIFYSVNSFNCELFLRYVPEYGIGVYAGRLFERNRPIENAIGIPVLLKDAVNTEFVNYMEGLNETHGVLLLGYSSMFNHVPQQDSLVRKHVSFDDSRMQFRPPHGESYDIVTEPMHKIFPGNQIFSFYGRTWFADRGLDEVTANELANRNQIVHIDDRGAVSGLLPGCPSRMTRFVGDWLEAAEDIPQGAVIEVARALLVPERRVSRGPISTLVWRSQRSLDSPEPPVCSEVSTEGESVSHCVEEGVESFATPYEVPAYSTNRRYAALLLGGGALYARANAYEGTANVDYAWWDVSALYEDRLPAGKCSLKMLVSFTANRDIAAGETLFVDLQEDSEGRRYANEEFSSKCL